MFDIYEEDTKKKSRFVLGKEGSRKMFVVGLNPSTANRNKSDKTIARVINISECEGFDGFVMVNLYPLRCTKPSELPKSFDGRLAKKNIETVFLHASREANPVFWAAWGINIKSRNYLIDLFERFVKLASRINVRWKHFGGLTSEGHPRHPLYVKRDCGFNDFDIQQYGRNLRQ